MESITVRERRERVQRAVFADMSAAFSDPAHPGFHLTAPSHFMIDVWGAIYHGGYYHIFLHSCEQRGELQQETVFFHARSKDLLHWTYLPVPIIADETELRLNDGCLCIDGKGTPLMLYTSVPKDNRIPRTHCAAVGSDDLAHFERIADNPFMTLDNHGGPAFGGGWSDPFVFTAQGRTFMLMSKCVDRDGRHRLPIYEATDDMLLHWEYKGILFENNGEVVNFFPLEGKWVLIYSPYAAIEYFVGDFDLDTLRFTPETHGILSYGYHSQENPIDRGFYATCLFNRSPEHEDRTLLYGWISGLPVRELWNGCVSVPRELHINQYGQLTQQPVGFKPSADVLALVEPGDAYPLSPAPYVCTLPSNQLSIALTYTSPSPLTLCIQTSTDAPVFTLTLREDGFSINAEDHPCDPFHGERVKRVFILLDRSVTEIFIGDGSVSATCCFDGLTSESVLRIDAEGGSIDSLQMTPIAPITTDTCLD